MMKRTIYQVDAFSREVFKGNPAAVCILDQWPADALMQQIANENNLSETAFTVPAEDCFEIRWFTPEIEVELCGHATLATAHVLFTYLDHPGDHICFDSIHSGRLTVKRDGDLLTLDFPADRMEEMVVPELIVTALLTPPLKAFRGKTDFLFVFASESEIETMEPDFGLLAQVGGRGVIVTAPGNDVDFVSRFFAPQSGINEDPVTGSAHTSLTPYWAKVLGKMRLTARQLSSRGGELICEDKGERVEISGHAVTYMKGELSF
ncbi:MAG: PhzF family phenazine biosynthesis protein [Bacteroidales bacterium]|nr:PhzF family phenazine biosynthesis protein [Bacteroidales bacterium]